AELVGDRQQQGREHHDGGKDVHHGADDQQDEVEQQQELQLAVDIVAHPVEQQHRYLSVDQQVGETHGHAENDQDAADQHAGFAQDRQQLPAQGQAVVNQRLEQ